MSIKKEIKTVLPVGIITSIITSPTNFSTNKSRHPTVTAIGFSRIDNDYFHSVATDLSGNYIAVGYKYNTSSENSEALIVKFDANGNLLWRKRLGGAGPDYFKSVTTDSAGNYIAVGNERSSNYYQALIVKFDTNGNVLWQKRLGDSNIDYFYSVATDSSGNYIAVGCIYNTSNNNSETLIVKFDTNGNALWQKRLGGGSSDRFYSVATDSSGNYIAVGYGGSSMGNEEALIAKFDTNGNLLWQKRLSGARREDNFYSVVTDSANNYIAVGYENSSSARNDEALIVKFDTNGNLLWQKRLVGVNNGYFKSVIVDSSDNYIVVGRESSIAGKYNTIIVKFNSDGTIVTDALSGILNTITLTYAKSTY